MATTYLPAKAPVLLGDDIPLEVTVTDEDGANLSGSTMTVEVLDSSGTEVLAAQSMTGTGTTSRVFTDTLTSDTGNDIEVAGRFLARYHFVHGTVDKWFEQVIHVRAVPPSYVGVYDWVYFLLPEVDESKIDFVVSGVVAELLVLGSCFTTYDALTVTQKVFFDKAVGFKAAYLLYNLPTTSSVVGSGEVKRITQGPVTWEYDVGTTSRTQGNTAYWLTEYENALREICPAALNTGRRMKSSVPVSNLPNSFDPRDSLYASDVERAAEA